MKQIIKSVDINSQDIDLINKYTRREMKPEEIFTFSVILCDNEIDREGESFTTDSLQKLSELFLGKTGIFDHNPTIKNQTARIFQTSVEATGEMTSFGEQKFVLKAKAYMVRSERCKDLIMEIDAGIIKEVSVGCRVLKKSCSICGAEYDGCCGHEIGQSYDGKTCYVMLVDPIDAYEWSFVAVPAQVGAGVVKGFEYNNQLEKQAQIGRRHLQKLRGEVVKLSFLNQFMVNNDAFAGLVSKMNIDELEAFKCEFSKTLNLKSAKPQLLSEEKMNQTNSQFVI